MKFMIIDFYRNTKLSKFIGCTKLLFKLFFLFFIPIYKKIVVYIKIKVFSMINERCKSFFYLIFAFLSYLYNIRYSYSSRVLRDWTLECTSFLKLSLNAICSSLNKLLILVEVVSNRFL